MKGTGRAKIRELTVNISFSQRLTVGIEEKEKQIKGNHESRASAEQC